MAIKDEIKAEAVLAEASLLASVKKHWYCYAGTVAIFLLGVYLGHLI